MAHVLAPLLPVSRYVVSGASMEPGYRAGERVLVNRIAYVLRRPAHGDVVVVQDPEDDRRHLLKRIAAAPDGDRPGLYYVLGDNQAESRDSREFGPVPRRLILGKAWRKY